MCLNIVCLHGDATMVTLCMFPFSLLAVPVVVKVLIVIIVLLVVVCAALLVMVFTCKYPFINLFSV